MPEAFSLYQVDKTTWDVGFVISSELVGTVADMVMQFSEPPEGPASSEDRLKLALNRYYRNWADTFDPDDGFSDEGLIVEPFMFTDEGMVLEGVMWTGPVGSGYKNGTGNAVALPQDSAPACAADGESTQQRLTIRILLAPPAGIVEADPGRTSAAL